ncbi:kinesin-like protein, putative [Plasmodium knowlesi strain H]|uniref:Kinesin-like protein, putative n=2 Tax=Plasmodium knowlesi TaxID=5850 RepID=A0A679KWD4_PLAKH|nr:kinesin-like protein, putative [Plasmodium knowlesi strain H]OTN64873.1 putative Kinesin-like protein [Plasmodium knowlesi]CAA9988488.1 kinesin-like protein, putative [Plasmodium knowlesi strain H]VVS77962.1 kinesin-like protein, putative [Plasmodium knowlesi strain H]
MDDHIKVFLRIKPNVENLSKLKTEDCAIYKVNNNQLHLYEKKKSYNDTSELNTKTFNFNHIFDVDIHQSDVFDLIGKNLVNNFMNGYNSSILAYGNTNSGKTYTLYGDGTDSENRQHHGLIYLSLSYFFHLQKLNKNTEISVSIVEIYLEKIRDLGKIFQLSQLATTTDDTIKYYSQFRDNIIREDEKGNTYVENITLLPIKNIDDVKNIINLCFKYRKTHATRKNLVSSRSHCLLTVYQHRLAKEKELISQINYIDLAGSEKFNDIEMVNKKELININNTLSVLNRVIIALSTQNKIGKNLDKAKTMDELKSEACCVPTVHIPYRDSKLTRLLKNSLNGNSFTYILICLNLNSHKIEDFINSLIFAKRCKMIKQKIKKNKVAKYSSQSDRTRSNSSSEENSYESFDSNGENYHFIAQENNKNIDLYHLDTLAYNKRRNKYRAPNNRSDAMMNKLLVLFTHIIKKKYNDLVKQKNYVANNLIKIIKFEENNQEELLRNKNYFKKILKKKKKELLINKEHLNRLINAKGVKAINLREHCQGEMRAHKHVVEDIEGQLSLNLPDGLHSMDIKGVEEYTSTAVQKEEQNFVDQGGSTTPVLHNDARQSSPIKISENENTATLDIDRSPVLGTASSPSTDSPTEGTNDIKRTHADIDELFQMELNKLSEKIKMLIKLNFQNISLFTNIDTLATILQNVYQKKYSVVLRNGKKTLNITNYNYDEFKKSCEFYPSSQSVLDNHTCEDDARIEGLDINIVSLYRRINGKKATHMVVDS